jgi:hypothetical protein
MTKDIFATVGTKLRLAVTSVCFLAACVGLTAQELPAKDTSVDNFQADVTNPSTRIHVGMESLSPADCTGDSFPLAGDFNRDSSFALLKEVSQADKPSAMPVIRAGYGQFFSAQNLVQPARTGIEAPSWLYLKVSFSF